MAANPSFHVAPEVVSERERVLKVLSETKSMPFLELASVADIDNLKLQSIVTELEENGVVTIRNRGSFVDEIVSLSVKNRLGALSV